MLFYVIISIVIGIILLLNTIFNVKRYSMKEKIVGLVIAFLYLIFGVIGFFATNEIIYILILLGIVIASFIVLILINKKKRS